MRQGSAAPCHLLKRREATPKQSARGRDFTGWRLVAVSLSAIAAYGETQRDRRATRHSAARLARGRASSRSGTRRARGFGGGGAPANAQPSALILCAAKRASVASPIPAALVLFRIAFFMVGFVVIQSLGFSSSRPRQAPRRGAPPRGRAFRSRVCEVLSFVHQGFVHHFRVLGVVIPPRFYCTAVSRGHSQKISSMSLPCWHLID